MGILRQLHLYISYGEEKLYVTAASVDRNTPPANADTSNLLPPPNPVSLQCTDPAVEGQFQPDGPDGAVTAKMTFAINSVPASGAVHVAPGSDAVCTIHANKGAVIASSTFALDPAVLGTDLGRELLKHVQIDERIAGDNTKPETKAFVFTVKTRVAPKGTWSWIFRSATADSTASEIGRSSRGLMLNDPCSPRRGEKTCGNRRENKSVLHRKNGLTLRA
jgi:hypothetical protein